MSRNEIVYTFCRIPVFASCAWIWTKQLRAEVRLADGSFEYLPPMTILLIRRSKNHWAFLIPRIQQTWLLWYVCELHDTSSPLTTHLYTQQSTYLLYFSTYSLSLYPLLVPFPLLLAIPLCSNPIVSGDAQEYLDAWFLAAAHKSSCCCSSSSNCRR